MTERTKPPVKSKLTKIPDRKIFADDLAVEVDGETYYPHAGEYVTFRGASQTVGDYLAALELQAADIRSIKADDVGDSLTDDQMQATKNASELFKRQVVGIQGHVIATDWTKNDGTPYSSPFTYDDLMSMSFEELNWLASGGRKKETPLAEESPSTSP